MNKRKYYYITDPFYSTVKDSQVTNWLEVLKTKGYNFDLIIITPILYVLKKNKFRKQKINQIKKILNCRIYQIPILKSKDITGFSDFIKTLILILIFVKSLLFRKKIIIQTRSLQNVYTLGFLKKTFKIKLIFDYRGAASEEFINSNGYKNIQDVDDYHIKKEYYKSLKKQKLFWKNADAICAVSDKLANYINNKSNRNYTGKISVIPGAADKEHFFFDLKLRNKIRKELHISEDTDCYVYTGKLGFQWHMKDFIFETMSEITNRNETSLFLCITPEVEIAENLTKKYNFNLNRILIKPAQYSEINEYLNAADFGILFRADITTNNVASPTKFPEYILAGLPVIISEGIGDYSDYVTKKNFGLTIHNKDTELYTKILELKRVNYNLRKEISVAAQMNYSKQANIEKLITIYKSL